MADNELLPDFVAAIEQALDADNSEAVRALVRPLHPADIADLFEQVPDHAREPLAHALGPDLSADVLAEMNDWVRDEVVATLDAVTIADAVSEMDTDDAVAIIEELEPAEQAAVLDELSAGDRVAIETALSYPEESAGRLMQRELVAVPEHFTIQNVVDYLRGEARHITDFWEIFVVDPAWRPVGTMRLSWVLTASPTPVSRR